MNIEWIERTQSEYAAAWKQVEDSGLDFHVRYGFSPFVRIGSVIIHDYPRPDVLRKALHLAQQDAITQVTEKR